MLHRTGRVGQDNGGGDGIETSGVDSASSPARSWQAGNGAAWKDARLTEAKDRGDGCEQQRDGGGVRVDVILTMSATCHATREARPCMHLAMSNLRAEEGALVGH